MNFEYKCIKSHLITNICEQRQTPENKEGGGWHYLDRHHVACSHRYVLQQFKLIRPNGGKIAYQFRCCRVEGNQSVSNYHRTRMAQFGGSYKPSNSQQLNGFNALVAPDHAAISSFLFKEANENMYYYDFGVTTLNEDTSDNFTSYARNTAWRNHGGGSFNYLTPLTINCDQRYSALSSLHFKKNGGQISWEYSCTESRKYISNSCKRKEGGWQQFPNMKDIQYMRNLPVSCGPKAGLRHFFYMSNGLYFKAIFTCCKVNAKTSTLFQDLSTGIGNRQNQYLDRQYPTAYPGEVISGLVFLTTDRLVSRVETVRFR
mmetsp:Transcript_40131/g.41861  ORF Transcript_40131/g.41861 Transcript_40131/m.41861 type:complete len:316 (+) Transcript_40131:3-950(+)